MKKRFRLNQLLIALLILTGAIVAGATDYIQADFDFSIFYKPAFWVNIITTNVGVVCIILAILLTKIDRFKLEDIAYTDARDYITDFYNNRFIPRLFRKFSAERNKNSKILAYKNNINKKYSKLKPSAKSLSIYKNGTIEQKNKNRYCKKVNYYNHLLDPTFINDTIDKKYIKYNAISESLVFSGVQLNNDKEDYVTKYKAIKIIKDLLPKFALSLGTTLLLSSILPDLADGITTAMIIKTCSKIFNMCMQIYFAINYSNRYCEEVVLHDIRFRKNIISEYNMWYATKEREIKAKEEVNNI